MTDDRAPAQGPYLGHKMDRKAPKVIGTLPSMLAPGEQVWALFVVNGMVPQTDFLVVTNCRIATGIAHGLRDKGTFKAVVFADQAPAIDKKGRVVGAPSEGDAVRLAPLLHKSEDLAALTHYVDSLKQNPAGAEVIEAAKGIRAGAFVPPPPDEVYLGSIKKADLGRCIDGAQASLVPGEQLRAMFDFKGLSGARLLAFTSARVLGLAASDDAGVPKAVWALNNAAVTNVTAHRLHGTVNAFITGSQGTAKTEIGVLRDAMDARALDHYGSELPAPDQDVAEGLAVAALPMPGRNLAPVDLTTSGAAAASQGVAAVAGDRERIEVDALAAGFPAKHVDLIVPILNGLAQAVEAADQGDIQAEEAALAGVARTAEQAGFAGRSRARAWANREMANLVAAGKIRRGAENIANVGSSLQIFSDRLLYRGSCYVMDRDVQASVEVDGQIMQSTRPTLGRMAIGSVLPGSALLVGLALPKTTTDDRRTANFIVVHPRWRIVERLNPDQAPQTRGVAAQINAIAATLARDSEEGASVPPAVSALPESRTATTSGVADQLAQLEKLEDLLSRGALTADQAAQMRQRILDS